MPDDLMPETPSIYLQHLWDAWTSEPLQQWLKAEDPASQPSESAAAMALEVALALGRCRLADVRDESIDDIALSLEMATAARDQLIVQLRQWTAAAKTVASRWEDADPHHREFLSKQLLQQRMDAWGIFLVLEDTYIAELTKGPPADANIEGWLNEVMDALEEFDSVLQQPENLQVMAWTSQTRLLSNWLRRLPEELREYPPWWLDGRLSELMEEMAEPVATTATTNPGDTPGKTSGDTPDAATSAASAGGISEEAVVSRPLQPRRKQKFTKWYWIAVSLAVIAAIGGVRLLWQGAGSIASRPPGVGQAAPQLSVALVPLGDGPLGFSTAAISTRFKSAGSSLKTLQSQQLVRIIQEPGAAAAAARKYQQQVLVVCSGSDPEMATPYKAHILGQRKPVIRRLMSM